MAKWFFHASFTPKIDVKVNIARKRLFVGSPDQFFWIPHVLAHQNCICPNFFKNFYYFYYFYIVIRFFGVSSSFPKEDARRVKQRRSSSYKQTNLQSSVRSKRYFPAHPYPNLDNTAAGPRRLQCYTCGAGTHIASDPSCPKRGQRSFGQDQRRPNYNRHGGPVLPSYNNGSSHASTYNSGASLVSQPN